MSTSWNNMKAISAFTRVTLGTVMGWKLVHQKFADQLLPTRLSTRYIELLRSAAPHILLAPNFPLDFR